MSRQAFNHLLKTLSPNEKDTLMKTAVTYGLTTDDPAWLILALNRSGLASIEKAIESLHKQRNIELEAFKLASKAEANIVMQQASNEAFKKISDALAKEVKLIHQRTKLQASFRWFICAAVLGVAFFIVTNTVSYYFLRNTFYEQARQEIYQAVYDENSRASWANTEPGRVAYTLSSTTEIQQLANCNNQEDGWKIMIQKNKRVCFPNTNPKGDVKIGWFIP